MTDVQDKLVEAIKLMQEDEVLEKDLSLREIASNKNISYQAVNDTLKKACKQLLEYEKSIKAFEMKKDLIFLIENVSSKNSI